MTREQVLKRLNEAWLALKESYAGLPDWLLLEPGVTGKWSVRDILAHITWWEEEALKHLPLILKGGRPPRYSVKYGGINAFNALMTERKKDLSLAEVFKEQAETHQRLIDYIEKAPAEQIATETRFRRRIKLDAYSHYPIHAKAIREWRKKKGF